MKVVRKLLVIMLGLAVQSSWVYARDGEQSQTDKCEELSTKTLCINSVASDKVKNQWKLVFKDGVITSAGTEVGSYTCKGNNMFHASLSMAGMDTVTVLGEVTSKEGKLDGYGMEAASTEYVFRVSGNRCKRS